jgi:hypothetical protein
MALRGRMAAPGTQLTAAPLRSFPLPAATKQAISFLEGSNAADHVFPAFARPSGRQLPLPTRRTPVETPEVLMQDIGSTVAMLRAGLRPKDGQDGGAVDATWIESIDCP